MSDRRDDLAAAIRRHHDAVQEDIRANTCCDECYEGGKRADWFADEYDWELWGAVGIGVDSHG